MKKLYALIPSVGIAFIHPLWDKSGGSVMFIMAYQILITVTLGFVLNILENAPL